MSEDHADRGCGAASNHVLVRTADVRRHDLEYDAVSDRFPCRIAEGGKVDVPNLDLARSEIDDATIGRHLESPLNIVAPCDLPSDLPNHNAAAIAAFHQISRIFGATLPSETGVRRATSAWARINTPSSLKAGTTPSRTPAPRSPPSCSNISSRLFLTCRTNVP